MGCTEKNPLMREGTSLQSRVLTALSPSFAQPDERKYQQIILFAKKYAAYLNYYKETNVPDGDWQPLMKMDISVSLASLISIDIRKCIDYKNLLYKKIKDTHTTPAEACTYFTFLFNLLFSLVQLTDEQYRQLPANSEYRAVIKNIFGTKILIPLVNLKNLFDVFNADGLIDTAVSLDANAPADASAAVNFNLNALGTEWATVMADPQWIISMQEASVSITIPGVQPKDKIIYIINHNLFNAQVDSLLKNLSAIISRAAGLFDETLNNFPTHSPHYALFITFIKLFRYAQDELNKYTQHHLDFYFKDVLRLKNKDPEPDKAHLVFELQKPVDKHLLKKDTLFKAGKDISGKEINYSLTEDVVLNKASVAKIHALQMLKLSKEVLFVSPVAASEDGQGTKLISPDKSWFTFGNPEKKAEASIGFAIASNILFLNEGKREVTVTVNFTNSIALLVENYPAPYSNYFSAVITGKKDWHSLDQLEVDKSDDGMQLIFRFTLQPDAPAIVPYSEKIHKENFGMELPVLKICLNQQNENAFSFRLFSEEKLESIHIAVDVTGIKDLMLSNDSGAIDAVKPFKPYGDFPEYNSSFYIGSKEIFQKKITAIEFDFENTDIKYNKTAEYLTQAKWEKISNEVDDNNLLPVGSDYKISATDFNKNVPLAVNTTEGFIRLRLDSGDFSKKSYMDLVKAQIDGTSIKRQPGSPAKYTIESGEMAIAPEIILDRFSLNYKASTDIFLTKEPNDRHSYFIHLTPFGYYETKFDSTEPSKKISLLPDMLYDGELMIGLADAEPGSVINILFHSAEGSSNPLRDFETVDWHFLAKNNWIAFKKNQVTDRTKNLTQSGIVTLTIPEDISNKNTVLEKELHWIKATVNKNPDAVCKMILVQAQAASLELVQNELTQVEFRQNIPANTISKFLISDGEIKTITQPADSFGGKTRETEDHFYIRVSERLRHKQRAVSIWDYEHIILEKFQQVYKVRCINHAGVYTGIDDTGELSEIFCETYPGHVTIITIPDFKNKTGINPLKPYTPASVRKNIDEYVHTIISPFVKLHVINPQFEEIQLEFEVTFHENLDPSFYRQLLDEEIEKFLTPWAYTAGHEIIFGQKIIKSVLLNFVEERPYVDFVTCFKMHHVIKRVGTVHKQELRDVEEAAGSTARSLLVSYSNEVNKIRHIIHTPVSCIC